MTRTTIEGVFENGVVKLSEMPTFEKPVKVFVVFMEEVESLPKKERKPGAMKGIIKHIAPDFDEPLEFKN